MQGADSGNFICNVCGAGCERPAQGLERETASCAACRSTVRLRALMALLSREIFGLPLALPEIPALKGIRGLGMSDLPAVAERLAQKFDYVNTYYDHAPVFDLTCPDERDQNRYDFILSSEVMEHVPPPVERAFATLFGMLKPDGLLVMTIPYSLDPETHEHFSALHEYALASLGGRPVLVNRRRDGAMEVFENLVFHGGHGSTLEMREFSEASLRSMLLEAGFSSVHFAAEAWPEFGVEHAEPWSLPIVARKGRFQPPAAELVREYRDLLRRAARLERDLSALDAAAAVHAELLRELDARTEWVHRVEGELQERTQWALNLERERNEAYAVNPDLQREVELRGEWARRVERELEERTRWALDLEREKNETLADFEHARASEAEAWKTVARLNGELQAARAQIASLHLATWTRLGRRLGLIATLPSP